MHPRFSLLLFALTIAILPTFVYASTQVGNGGVVVICSHHSGRDPVRILDFIDAELIWEIPIRQDFRASDPVAIASEVLDVLKRLDPARGARYETQLSTFMAESKFLVDVMLSRTEDEANIALPDKCVIGQAVVQIQPKFPEDRRYYFDAEIWDQLSAHPIDQAALIVHELIYREAVERGQTQSRNVRYVTSRFFADDFSRLTLDAYRAIIAQAGLNP